MSFAVCVSARTSRRRCVLQARSAYMLDGRVALRFKLPRGSEGVELSQKTCCIVGLTGTARESLLLGDCCILADRTAFLRDCKASRCEITVLRDDATMIAALREQGLIAEQGALEEQELPCFRLLKLPLRKGVEDLHSGGGVMGIQVQGLVVTKVSGQAQSDALIRVGDIIVRLGDRPTDSSSLAALLCLSDIPSIQVLTVLRRCPDHDVTHLEALASLQERDEKEVGEHLHACAPAQESVALQVPITPSPQNRDDTSTPEPPQQECEHSHDPNTADSVGQAPPLDLHEASITASTHSIAQGSLVATDDAAGKGETAVAVEGDVQGDQDAEGAPEMAVRSEEEVNSTPFDPLDGSQGLWCDLPPQMAPPLVDHHYDANTGAWSDLPPPEGGTLDDKIREALVSRDDSLLRELVADQQRARVAAAPSGDELGLRDDALLPRRGPPRVVSL